jgi:2-polyprenyl-3-methyl-5-hydroxy-6-metoxy-1,4-benzoquinol methylase
VTNLGSAGRLQAPSCVYTIIYTVANGTGTLTGGLIVQELRQYSGFGERIVPGEYHTVEDYINYLKHCKAYHFASHRFKGKEVVDLGCGSGYGTEVMADSVRRIVGLDVDREVVDALNRSNRKENLQFQAFDGTRVPLSDASVDAVVSLQVIEHVADVPRFLEEIHRILKPSGEAMFTTPNRRIRLLPFQKPWNPYHLREYTFEQLDRLLRKYFATVQGYAMLADEEVTRLDLGRTRQSPLKVYFLYPTKAALKKVSPFLRRVSRDLHGTSSPLPRDVLEEYGIDRFDYVQRNDSKSLDLMFIAARASTPT